MTLRQEECGIKREKHSVEQAQTANSEKKTTPKRQNCISLTQMSIPFYVLSAVNSAIVRIDMFQKWLQLPTGGKVAELQGL